MFLDLFWHLFRSLLTYLPCRATRAGLSQEWAHQEERVRENSACFSGPSWCVRARESARAQEWESESERERERERETERRENEYICTNKYVKVHLRMYWHVFVDTFLLLAVLTRICKYICSAATCLVSVWWVHLWCKYSYGVATSSRLLTIIGLFCKRAL